MYDFHDSTDTLKFWTEKWAINKKIFVFHLILMKLVEVVVIHVYYNLPSFIKIGWKNKKSFINSPFFCSEIQSVSRIVNIVQSDNEFSVLHFKFGKNRRNPHSICVQSISWIDSNTRKPDFVIPADTSSLFEFWIDLTTSVCLYSFGCYGNGEGEFDCLAGVAVNKIGQYIIADRYNHRIQIFDATGHFIRAFGSQGTVDGKFSYPWGITTDNLGLIYVCDKENHRVQVWNFSRNHICGLDDW